MFSSVYSLVLRRVNQAKTLNAKEFLEKALRFFFFFITTTPEVQHKFRVIERT